MDVKKVVDDVYRLSVNIEDKNYLFEGIWPIPHGISINGYLIKSEKNILIDLTQNIFDFPQEITHQMSDVTLGIEDIDIIVVNHMEPDHSGWLREFCKKNSKAVIYCTKKAIPLLEAFAAVPPERAIAITDGMRLPADPERSSGRRSRTSGMRKSWVHEYLRTPEEALLWERLRAWRSATAKAAEVPPYVIFHDRTLLDIVLRKPRERAGLSEVEGMRRRFRLAFPFLPSPRSLL